MDMLSLPLIELQGIAMAGMDGSDVYGGCKMGHLAIAAEHLTQLFSDHMKLNGFHVHLI